jgi:type IV secretory pathway component VirB8
MSRHIQTQKEDTFYAIIIAFMVIMFLVIVLFIFMLMMKNRDI